MNDKTNTKWLSISAKLNGKNVRLTVAIADIDIVSRDNVTDFDVRENFPNLTEIEYEDIYHE